MTDLERAWHPSVADSRGLRLAHSLIRGMTELNALFPNRPQGAQEGTIGDATHRAEGTGSDHNPDAAGVVRAWDIDCTAGAPFDPQTLANHLAAMMRTVGRYNLFGSRGYVIFNHRITAWSPWGAWAPYSGTDPHTQHIHVSVGALPSEYDDVETWNLATAFPAVQPVPQPAPAPKPTPRPQPVTLPLPESGQLFVRFLTGGHNNPAAVYRLCGSQLLYISAADYAALGRPPVRVLDALSGLWRLPIVPGTPDYRK